MNTFTPQIDIQRAKVFQIWGENEIPLNARAECTIFDLNLLDPKFVYYNEVGRSEFSIEKSLLLMDQILFMSSLWDCPVFPQIWVFRVLKTVPLSPSPHFL